MVIWSDSGGLNLLVHGDSAVKGMCLLMATENHDNLR